MNNQALIFVFIEKEVFSFRIKDTNFDQLGLIPETYRRMGVKLSVEGDDINVHQRDICEIEAFIDGSTLTVHDHTWPGLTPDLLSVVLVLATQCR